MAKNFVFQVTSVQEKVENIALQFYSGDYVFLGLLDRIITSIYYDSGVDDKEQMNKFRKDKDFVELTDEIAKKCFESLLVLPQHKPYFKAQLWQSTNLFYFNILAENNHKLTPQGIQIFRDNLYLGILKLESLLTTKQLEEIREKRQKQQQQ